MGVKEAGHGAGGIFSASCERHDGNTGFVGQRPPVEVANPPEETDQLASIGVTRSKPGDRIDSKNNDPSRRTIANPQLLKSSAGHLKLETEAATAKQEFLAKWNEKYDSAAPQKSIKEYRDLRKRAVDLLGDGLSKRYTPSDGIDPGNLDKLSPDIELVEAPVVIAGAGPYGLVLGALLSQKGHRVVVFDENDFEKWKPHKEYNISFDLLNTFVEAGLFTNADIEEIVCGRFAKGLVSSLKEGVSSANSIGDLNHVEINGILDTAIDAKEYLSKLRSVIDENGGTILDNTSFKNFKQVPDTQEPLVLVENTQTNKKQLFKVGKQFCDCTGDKSLIFAANHLDGDIGRKFFPVWGLVGKDNTSINLTESSLPPMKIVGEETDPETPAASFGAIFDKTDMGKKLLLMGQMFTASTPDEKQQTKIAYLFALENDPLLLEELHEKIGPRMWQYLQIFLPGARFDDFRILYDNIPSDENPAEQPKIDGLLEYHSGARMNPMAGLGQTYLANNAFENADRISHNIKKSNGVVPYQMAELVKAKARTAISGELDGFFKPVNQLNAGETFDAKNQAFSELFSSIGPDRSGNYRAWPNEIGSVIEAIKMSDLDYDHQSIALKEIRSAKKGARKKYKEGKILLKRELELDLGEAQGPTDKKRARVRYQKGLAALSIRIDNVQLFDAIRTTMEMNDPDSHQKAVQQVERAINVGIRKIHSKMQHHFKDALEDNFTFRGLSYIFYLILSRNISFIPKIIDSHFKSRGANDLWSKVEVIEKLAGLFLSNYAKLFLLDLWQSATEKRQVCRRQIDRAPAPFGKCVWSFVPPNGSFLGARRVARFRDGLRNRLWRACIANRQSY